MEVTKSINFCLYLIVLQIHIFEGDRKIFHHFGKFLKSIKTFTLKAFFATDLRKSQGDLCFTYLKFA